MRSTHFIIYAIVSFATSLIALAGIDGTSAPELNSFASAVNFPVGQNPEAIAVGDFNGDGKSDLAVANSGSDNLSVLLGFGDGTFQTASNYPGICFGPNTVAIGDFNGDNKLDIVTLDGRCSSGNMFRGNGNGTFQAATAIAAGFCPQAVIAADFNRDGKLDRAMANAEGCPAAPTKENPNAPDITGVGLSIALGNGNGSFQPLVSYPVNLGPFDLISGDFNRDTILDIAVTGWGANTVSVLFGNGNGTFQPQTAYSVGTGPFSITKGDFNFDGLLDLAVANSQSNNVSVLLGNFNGTFRPATNYAAGVGPESIIATNVNGDGYLDLVTANLIGNNISVLLGASGGAFQPPINYTAGTRPSAVVSGDFNGDNQVDLAVTNRLSNNVSILIKCPGTVTFAQPNQFFTMNGGPGGVNVSVSAICEWQAVSNANWIVITSPDNNIGNARVEFEVRENFTSAARQGSISVASTTFNVIQSGGLGEGCQYAISPTSQSFFTPDAAIGTINVTAGEACAWQAVSDSSWIEITSSNHGIGNGTVNYFVAANLGSTTRKGKITVAGQTFTIKQKSF